MGDDPAPPPPRAPRADGPPVDVAPPAPYAAPAWEDVVRDHGDRVFRLAYRLAGNRARRRGPHPGGLRPCLPVAVAVHAGHVRGVAAPDHDQPVPRQVRRKARIRFDALAATQATASPGASRGRPQVYNDANFDPDIAGRARPAAAGVPRRGRAVRRRGLTYEEIAAMLGGQARHRPQPHPPGPVAAADALAHRAPRTGTATRMPEPLAPTGPLR